MCPITRPVGDRPRAASTATRSTSRRLVVAVLSHGRPELLARSVCALTGQSRLPDEVILAVTSEADINRRKLGGLPFPVRVAIGPGIVPAHCNKVLDRLRDSDVVQFQADDLLLSPDHLASVDRYLENDAGVAFLHAPIHPMPKDDDTQRSASSRAMDRPMSDLFAMRLRPAQRHALRFDATLLPGGPFVLQDFCQQMEAHGGIAEAPELAAFGDPDRRINRPFGKAIGYAQIAEPIHLRKQGRMSGAEARDCLSRSLVANVFRLPAFGRPAHKRGLLAGNLRGLAHLATGRLDPRRAEAD